MNFYPNSEWLETTTPDIKGTEEPLLRAQNRCIGVQVGEMHDAVSGDLHKVIELTDEYQKIDTEKWGK